MNTPLHGDAPDFLAEDYKFTADLLRKYRYGVAQDTAMFRAVCDHNLPIILQALLLAEAHATYQESLPGIDTPLEEP